MSSVEPFERVRIFIESQRIDAIVRVLPPESTKTSEMAAKMLGCTIDEIAKTICFVVTGKGEPRPVLVTLSGARQVSLGKLARELGVSDFALRKMSAQEVKVHTGYSVGGVPPFPHYPGVSLLADSSLFQFAHVWAAAGTNNSVVRIEPSVFRSLLKVPVVEVSDTR